MHQTIKKVSTDFEAMKFNTAIAAMMSLINEISAKGSINKAELRTLLLLLDPFAPHLCEEMWQVSGFEGQLNAASWPVYDESKCSDTTVELAVQVCGKVRDRITVSVDASPADAIAAAKQSERVAPLIEGKTVIKELYVPQKLVNIVVK